MKTPTCDLCNSTKIQRQNNIGFDIDPEGEENQHIETCLDCKASRFVTDWFGFDGKAGTFYGKWRAFDPNAPQF